MDSFEELQNLKKVQKLNCPEAVIIAITFVVPILILWGLVWFIK